MNVIIIRKEAFFSNFIDTLALFIQKLFVLKKSGNFFFLVNFSLFLKLDLQLSCLLSTQGTEI